MKKVLAVLAVAAFATPALAEYATADVTGGGKITGHVTYKGAKPVLPDEKRDKNPDICGTKGANQTLLVGAGNGIANTIVYIKDIKAGKAMTPVTADIDQKGCSYAPHVQAVPAGSTLNILNDDPLLHNIHASQGGTTVFNYAMPLTVKKIPKKVSKPGFITIKCDVHGWMNGAVGVMDNPYFAVTGEDGSYTIDDVPAGTYTVGAWQERLHDKTAPVTVAAGAPATVDFSYSGL